jgi:hypothetical protein
MPRELPIRETFSTTVFICKHRNNIGGSVKGKEAEVRRKK